MLLSLCSADARGKYLKDEVFHQVRAFLLMFDILMVFSVNMA